MRHFLIAVLCAGGCSDPAEPPPPAREVVLETSVDASGLSPDLMFAIPDGTRSITIVVEGANDSLYAIGAFAMGDDVDLVQLPDGSPTTAMQTSYEQEQIGQMPGGLFQSIRLGTLTHVYPYRPGQTVIAGDARMRIAGTRPGPAKVTITMPEDDGANRLVLDLHVVSDTLVEPNTPSFIAELERIFARANVAIEIGQVDRLTGTAFEQITDFNEPQETPTSQSAKITGLVADRASTALDVFYVEGLPAGVGGLSLGTPGPPRRGSYYFGVIVRGGFPDVEMARITAHEVAHFVALQHVENQGVSGMRYPDPLDDTMPGSDNLMAAGTVLSAGQAFALSRSALLRTD